MEGHATLPSGDGGSWWAKMGSDHPNHGPRVGARACCSRTGPRGAYLLAPTLEQVAQDVHKL